MSMKKTKKPKITVHGIETHDALINQLNNESIYSKASSTGGLPIETVLWGSNNVRKQ
jgi:hypothetical protein